MKKIVKFGGSSLASAEQFKKVGNIINADASRVYVVPSAPGKRFSEDTKVTDMLLHLYETAKEGKDLTEELAAIKARYDEIITGLELKDFSLDEDFAIIKKTLEEEPLVDYAASRGEFLNGKIMAAYLGVQFIDAADVIFFNSEGNLNDYKTNKTLSEQLKKYDRAVIPGFYGMGKDGKVKTFSRGGSDVTGSIVARACKADVYENWTDVSGFLVADPRIVD
ncbi:MAG: aspartate kinase, partial [Lachnospiraceae bacterium]|nr:aspartate kinase [Lachnospiraceae bacterium]